MSLLAWYPLTSDLVNHGVGEVTTSGTPTFSTGGKLGNCMTGNDITINIPSLANSKVWSICFWGYAVSSAITSNWTLLVRVRDNGSHFRFEACPSSYGNGIYCYSTHNNANYAICNDGMQAPSPGFYDQWCHVCVTCDGTTITGYYNGEVRKSWAYTGTGAITGIFDLTNNAKCKKNDLRIYSHCLSALEVKQISQALLLHYPMTGGGRGCANLVQDSYVNTTSSSYGFGARSVNITEGKTYTVSARGYISSAAVTSGTKLAVYFYKSDWSYAPAILSITDTSPTTKFATFTATQTTTLRITSYSFKGQGTAGDPVTAIWYKVEEGDKATPWMPNSTDTEYNAMGYNDNIEYDVSGYLHNGTRVGTFSWSSDTPRYSVSTVFANANSNYISLGSKTFDMTSVTFSAWFKIKTAKTWSRIFDFGASEGAGYCIGLATGSNGTTLTVWGRLGSAGSSLPDKQIQTISLNTWYHAVITISGTTCSCYVNGQLVVSFSINSAFPSATTFNYIYFGKSVFSADKYLDGNISDFRMYATALSAEDIQKLYNTSASLANNGTLMAYEFTEM